MPAGRPTDYKPEFCEMLVEHMKTGKTFESFGATVNCGKRILYEWVNLYPEFMQAKDLGEAHARAFWENVCSAVVFGRLSRLKDPNGPKDGPTEYCAGNPHLLSLLMKNRFGWRNQNEIEVSVVKSPFSEWSEERRIDAIKEYLNTLKLIDDATVNVLAPPEMENREE